MGGPDLVCTVISSAGAEFRRREFKLIYKALRRRGVSGDETAPQMPAAVLASENTRPAWKVDPADFPVRMLRFAPFGHAAIPGLPDPDVGRRPELPEGGH